MPMLAANSRDLSPSCHATVTAPGTPISAEQLVQLSRHTRQLAKQVAKDVMAASEKRLDQFIAQHDRLLKETLALAEESMQNLQAQGCPERQTRESNDDRKSCVSAASASDASKLDLPNMAGDSGSQRGGTVPSRHSHGARSRLQIHRPSCLSAGSVSSCKSRESPDVKIADLEKAIATTLTQNSGLCSSRSRSPTKGRRSWRHEALAASISKVLPAPDEKLDESATSPPSQSIDDLPRVTAASLNLAVASPADQHAVELDFFRRDGTERAGMEPPGRLSSSVGMEWSTTSSHWQEFCRTHLGNAQVVGKVTTSQLRIAHDGDLVKMGLGQEAQESTSARDLWKYFPWVALWLCLWGIFPCGWQEATSYAQAFKSHFNRLVVLCLGILVVLYRLVQVCQNEVAMHHLGDFLMALSVLACHASTHPLHRCDLFSVEEAVLLRYSEQRGFWRTWRAQSRRHLLEILIAWTCAVVARVVLGGARGWTGLTSGYLVARSVDVLDILAFGFTTGTFLSAMFPLLHFTNGLVRAIDNYTYHFMLAPDYVKGAHEWNVLQATLRSASNAMECCFLTSVSTCMLMIFICASEAVINTTGGVPMLIPTMILVPIMAHVLFSAACVTGRCKRVPPFINSLYFGTDMNQRQFLVRYIADSAAGFYISEVPVNAEGAGKLVYLGTMAVMTIVAKLVASTWFSD